MLARGETMGTFQLGGSGMTKWLKELKPTRVEDLMIMVALFRPDRWRISQNISPVKIIKVKLLICIPKWLNF